MNQKAHAPARRPSHWLKNIALSGLALLVLLSLAGAGYQAVATGQDRRNYPPPGKLVDVGGYRLHIHCVGEGSPTIILAALSGGTTPIWGWVQPELAQTSRVCAYDRAGWGWSDDGPAPRDAQQTVAELHTLLERAGEPGPYVLVGHSLGGLYVRLFADQYPGEVAGMVLLDSSHPDQNATLPPEDLEAEQNFARLLPVFAGLNGIGVSHLYFALGGEIDFADLPAQQNAEMKAFWSSPRHYQTQMTEGRARPAANAQVRAAGSLGDLPLAVVSAGVGSSPDWLALQADLATLSTNQFHLIADEASHASLALNPEHAQRTSAAILQVVAAARTGEPLAAP